MGLEVEHKSGIVSIFIAVNYRCIMTPNSWIGSHPDLDAFGSLDLFVNIHGLGTATNLHFQLPLTLRLGQRLLKITVQFALVGGNLLPSRRHLIFDLLQIDLHLIFVDLHLCKALTRRQQVLVLLDQLPVLFTLALLISAHARLVEGTLSPRPNLRYSRHGLEGCLYKVAVVADRDVAALGKRKGAIDRHFLAVRTAERFCPRKFTRVALHFEVLVAFGFAEPKGFCIVADKSNALGRVHGGRAKVARFDPHGCRSLRVGGNKTWRCRCRRVP